MHLNLNFAVMTPELELLQSNWCSKKCIAHSSLSSALRDCALAPGPAYKTHAQQPVMCLLSLWEGVIYTPNHLLSPQDDGDGVHAQMHDSSIINLHWQIMRAWRTLAGIEGPLGARAQPSPALIMQIEQLQDGVVRMPRAVAHGPCAERHNLGVAL
jgi:hypothetical protein